jgi:hypothetical protein
VLIASRTRQKRVDFKARLNLCSNRAEDTKPKRLAWQRSIREDSMKTPAALFPIALALAALSVASVIGARADGRQEGPIEIEKCQTIDEPGSYRLVNNLTLTNPTGVCLQITADNVTIDLAGFTIAGPQDNRSAAIAGVSPNELFGVTVRNGSISGFGSGVSLGSNSIVEELRITGFFFGAIGGISATGIVRGNIVSGIGNSPGSPGLGISATGIVTGNFVEDNGRGMEIGTGSTVIGNTASGNRTLGISVDCPSNVTNNTAVFNTSTLVGGANLLLNVPPRGEVCNSTNNVAP